MSFSSHRGGRSSAGIAPELYSDLNGTELGVFKQKVTYGKKEIKLPKREKVGLVAVLEFGLKPVQGWIEV